MPILVSHVDFRKWISLFSSLDTDDDGDGDGSLDIYT